LGPILWLAASLATAGCYQPPAGTPDFQDGYHAGCDDAAVDSPGAQTGQTTWMRDEARIAAQPDYKEGWYQGYVACYRKWLDHPSMSNTGT
jgi:hypothetical protein